MNAFFKQVALLDQQALSKLERGHERDLADVRAMLERGVVSPQRLEELFAAIEPELIRYPAVDPATLRAAVIAIANEKNET